ncbi:sigma-70 family RNA polymerase sigma factor [Stieleria sp. ICT_E10.1]|uniref:sigma-70 family RNA polymerase sigma factor n=1 Tax=Stieleria sedimenti TaxID=2976331 RepID=UPI0021802EE7|nr:sigma-70 family RNA polymerase sigma factor [Stieleria sedimenti]MCS7467717.1 sigma-70 family RNA polymerase sigma factor [Stieleria sedimenti]
MDPNAKPDFETAAGREARYGEFVSLLARHDQSIRRFVRSLLPSNQGVDDVMQETALECWKKYESFTPENAEDAVDEFIRWACVIARYKVLSWQRDNSRDRLMFRESVIERLAQDAMQDLEQRDRERKAIETCLGQLDADQRRLVLSVHSPGESITKIAQETGVKTRRLYSKVNALRKRLLDCVQGRLVEEL